MFKAFWFDCALSESHIEASQEGRLTFESHAFCSLRQQLDFQYSVWVFFLIKRFGTYQKQFIPVPSIFYIWYRAQAQVFIREWVVRFGIPWHIISDWDPQFACPLWAGTAQSLSVECHQTILLQVNTLIDCLPPKAQGCHWGQSQAFILVGQAPMGLCTKVEAG